LEVNGHPLESVEHEAVSKPAVEYWVRIVAKPDVARWRKVVD
jgi:hypothetical protein